MILNQQASYGIFAFVAFRLSITPVHDPYESNGGLPLRDVSTGTRVIKHQKPN